MAVTKRFLQAMFLGTLATSFVSLSSAAFNLPSPYSWSCIDGKCHRKEINGIEKMTSFSTCKLTCGHLGVLWPKPTGVANIGNETVHFNLPQLTLQRVKAPTEEVKNLVKDAFGIFKENVAVLIPEDNPEENGVRLDMEDIMKRNVLVDVEIFSTGRATRLTLNTNEAYTMNIITDDMMNTNVTILSSNFFGARHALETLSQFIEYDENKLALEIVSSAAISDAPEFKYRGILLDTARNFISVKAIENTLDAMAANKLNTLHWHITDSSSFPLYLKSLPEMAFYGAYSNRQVYKPTDIHHLVEYARVRGIRILPEIDAPGHIGNGWQWTENKKLGQAALCVNEDPWTSYCSDPPCGQLNIANPNSLNLMGRIYAEVLGTFGPLDVFHFGGSEININCWNKTQDIIQYMASEGSDRSTTSFLKLWADFQSVAYGFVTLNGGKEIPGILWNSNLTGVGHVDRYLDPRKYIIQISSVSNDAPVKELLQKGFNVIFSNDNAWSLDCGFGSWMSEGAGKCGHYKGWQTVYDNNPRQMARNLTGSAHKNLILGGEAILWTHQVDEASLDSKLWPRGSALGERLWSNPDHNWEQAEGRFIHHRQRLVKRGIRADRIQPQWCHQNEGFCYIK